MTNYYSTRPGLGSTAQINTTSGDDGVRIIQSQLQRLGFLAPGTGRTGADGKWGPRTELAMQNAARYVGYTGAPFTVEGTTVTVPDDLMYAIQNAPPAQQGTPGVVSTAGGGGGDGGASSVIDTTTTMPTTTMPDSGGGFPWGTVLIIGGGVAALAALAYALRNRKYPTTVQAKGPAMRGPRIRARARAARRQARKIIRFY